MRIKHTQLYKDNRNFYRLSIFLIFVGGLTLIIPIRHIANDPIDFWTFYDAAIFSFIMVQIVHLHLLAYEKFKEICAKERNPEWKTNRRRYEYLCGKRLKTMEEVDEFIYLHGKVDYL